MVQQVKHDLPTRDEMLARATALVPTLRERSARCEELRRIPPETVEDFVTSGILRMAQPLRFGGLGLGIDAVCDVAMEMGLGCPSTAWMAGQWPGHNFMVGYFSDEAQQEYFAPSPNTMSSTASAIVRLDAEPVEGGMKVSGQLKFSSGVDAAEWILLFAPLGMSLVPKSDFEVVDDWYVTGLRGTGSKGVRLDDVFIPAHRTIALEALRDGTSYGPELYPDNPFYRVPMNITLNSLLVASTIGMARGLIDIFDERVRTRMDGHTFQPAFQRPGTQLRFAEATAEVDAAVLVLRGNLAQLVEYGSSGQQMTLLERGSVRRNVAFATKLCINAANRLLESGDASGQYDSQLLQRWGRDIHMAGLQYVLTWDEPALAYSRIRWGLEPEAIST